MFPQCLNSKGAVYLVENTGKVGMVTLLQKLFYTIQPTGDPSGPASHSNKKEF